jgi:hypothetical protein
MEPLRHHHGHHSSSHHVPKVTVDYGPTEAQIKHNKRKALARPGWARVLIRLFTLAVSIALVTVLAQSTAVWYSTRHAILQQPNGFRMPSWPNGMNMTPSYVMLAVAALAVIVQILAALTLVGGVCRNPNYARKYANKSRSGGFESRNCTPGPFSLPQPLA